MSARVLLNFLKSLRESDKMRGNDFNKFNKTGARMLDSYYHMTLEYFKIERKR